MRNFKIFILCSLLLPVWTGCKKSLDYNETSFYNETAVFESPSLSKAFLTTIYSYLPTDFNEIDGAMRASASDDAVHVWDLSAIKRFNDGSWNALQPLDEQWGRMYSGIRAATLFLKKSEGQTFEDTRYNENYPQIMAQYNLYKYEARFLRAFFYLELIKRYGDVPLITTILTPEEANAVTRTPFDEVVKYIVAECNDIIPHLPERYNGLPASETGRATKGAAMALKARTLLYAASPLNNPSNNNAKWVAAAQAAKEVMDLQVYSLEGNYSDIVNNINSSELILETRQAFSNAFEVANTAVGFQGGNTGTCPTENLVESYEMQATGLKINENGSGYDAANPYEGRDPRFYATILYNGATWKNQEIEVWHGGFNGAPNERATKTGYYLKKYLIESISLNPVNPTSQQHTWVIFRLGDIILNYAEAMNEAYGPDALGAGNLQMSATDAVNLVRARANMPGFAAGMSQDDFREKLRNERRVELAFEDSRFWDIRRWKIGKNTTDIYGVNVTKNNGGTLSYARKLVEKRVWNERMNLYPIAQSEIFINGNLVQNTDW